MTEPEANTGATNICKDCREYENLEYCKERLFAFNINKCPNSSFINKNQFTGGINTCIYI